jgi:hypothetical protein
MGTQTSERKHPFRHIPRIEWMQLMWSDLGGEDW